MSEVDLHFPAEKLDLSVTLTDLVDTHLVKQPTVSMVTVSAFADSAAAAAAANRSA